MSFISNVLDSIPVVGHVKGSIHYLVGDTEGGHKAMYQSSRTTAVLGAGAAGCLAGPAVGALAAINAGMAVDIAVSAATGKTQGMVNNVGNIGRDIADGKNPTGSIVSTGVQLVMDGAGGLGMGGVSNAASQISEKAVANTIQKVGEKVVTVVGEKTLQKSFQVSAAQVTNTIAKKASERVVKKVIEQTALAAEVALVSAHVEINARNRTQQEKEERYERKEAERRAQVERDRRIREEAERRAREEAERRAQELRERGIREEAERRARQEVEGRAQEERERRIREETERRAREEREQREREANEERARAELQQRARAREQTELAAGPVSRARARAQARGAEGAGAPRPAAPGAPAPAAPPGPSEHNNKKKRQQVSIIFSITVITTKKTLGISLENTQGTVHKIAFPTCSSGYYSILLSE